MLIILIAHPECYGNNYLIADRSCYGDNLLIAHHQFKVAVIAATSMHTLKVVDL